MSVSVSAEETAAKVLNRTCETLWVLSIIILLYFNSTYQQAPTFTLWTHSDDDSCLWVEEEKSVNEKWRQLTAVPSGLNRDCNGQLPGTIWTWLSIFSGHFRSQSWLFNCFKKRTWECTEVMNVRGLFCVVENDHTAEREFPSLASCWNIPQQKHLLPSPDEKLKNLMFSFLGKLPGLHSCARL